MWLWNGFLDRSHELSQNIETPEAVGGTASCTVETRCGQCSYWFRRVGDHSLFSTLGEKVREHAKQTELPDEAQWLSQCTTGNHNNLLRHVIYTPRSNKVVCRVLREVAAIEWYTLFDYCRSLACGNHR